MEQCVGERMEGKGVVKRGNSKKGGRGGLSSAMSSGKRYGSSRKGSVRRASLRGKCGGEGTFTETSKFCRQGG